MFGKNKPSQSEIDGVQYRRAKTWQIILMSCNSIGGMSFYTLLGMASYVANAGYGVATAVVGLILTGTRIFDGITDPLCALFIDKFNTRFGKIRILMTIGWIIQVLSLMMMYVWGSGKGYGIVMFIAIYVIYIIGYTINNVTAQTATVVMTNDPKQRPMLSVWGTVFNYFVPMTMNIVLTVILLPRFGNEYNVEFLAMACKICVAASCIGWALCCIGVTGVDKPENFASISNDKKDAVSMKDMVSLLKDNIPMQRYTISAASDKIAQQTASQAIITTMLFGIIIGNMQLSTILTMIGMLPSIIFAVMGAKYAGRHGNKESTVTWTRVCVVISVVMIAFFIIIDPRQISVSVPMMVIYVFLTLALNGAKMCVTTANSAMRADVVDFELDRSGKYMPAAVSGTYNFIDKLVTSLSATIAAGAVALIGYKNTMPQPNDTLTPSIFWLTMGIYFGLPILGWICTLAAMHNCPLSKVHMVEVQKRISEKKAAAKAA